MNTNGQGEINYRISNEAFHNALVDGGYITEKDNKALIQNGIIYTNENNRAAIQQICDDYGINTNVNTGTNKLYSN